MAGTPALTSQDQRRSSVPCVSLTCCQNAGLITPAVAAPMDLGDVATRAEFLGIPAELDVWSGREDEVTTGLIIVDMLEDFIGGKWANPAAKPIVEPIAALAREARRREDWVVIYANDAHQPGDFEFKVLGEHALAGSPGAQVIPELRPHEGDLVVPKRYYSAFTDTDLDTTCRVRNIRRVVIVGQHTDCCCHTAYDAFRRGLDITVVPDATCLYQPMAEGQYEQRQHLALDYLHTFYGAKFRDTDTLLKP